MYNWNEASEDYFDQLLRFGKHRNKKISEVLDKDPQYIRWLLQQEWLDNSIRSVIEKEIDKRRQPRTSEKEPETPEEQSKNKSKVEKVILEALTSRGWTTAEAEQMIRRMKS